MIRAVRRSVMTAPVGERANALAIAAGGGSELSRLYRDVRAGPFMQPFTPHEGIGYLGSVTLGVDMHPAARIGSGIMLDHATGIVVGETAVIEDDVSILHAVTLGGSGKESGDRHPKIRRGVLLSAGAKVIGNIEVGECAKVGAGSVVLDHVPPHATVAGVPAKIVGTHPTLKPSMEMDHSRD